MASVDVQSNNKIVNEAAAVTIANIMDANKRYLPENYNPADYPAVQYRNKNSSDNSETQRKRRSKNRLSNRRSTGFVSKDYVEAAFKMGPEGEIENRSQ